MYESILAWEIETRGVSFMIMMGSGIMGILSLVVVGGSIYYYFSRKRKA